MLHIYDIDCIYNNSNIQFLLVCWDMQITRTTTMLGALLIVAIVSAVTTTPLAANTFLLSPVFGQQEQQQKILRIGYFPNINHAQAVIGIGNGDFQKILGPNVEIKPFIFNAGPSAIEALFAKQIDATYVGPNPAINGYVISEGKDVRIISGATSGGAVFVIRGDTGITSI